MKKKSLVIGGSNGIGLAIGIELSKICNEVHIVDKVKPELELPSNVYYFHHNLIENDFTFLSKYDDINILIITAGFGRISPFESITEPEIFNCFFVNSISTATILNHFFNKMKSAQDFYCAVMGSIAGLVSSPLFALYGSTKAAVCKLIESLNIELEESHTENRILNVSPGSIKGTKFNGGKNEIELIKYLAQDIISFMMKREVLFIPEYDSIYKKVLTNYFNNPHNFGINSYKYKSQSGRLNLKPQVKIGYLSGTFDMFHIGHLNLIKRAKEFCDYLVVGVHKDASHKNKIAYIPFEERIAIVKSIKYVDKAIQSEAEDIDIYLKGIVKFDYLFVGSDYKGSERFNRYEDFFKDKNVEIIYFPCTINTSSTQLREYISNNSKIQNNE